MPSLSSAWHVHPARHAATYTPPRMDLDSYIQAHRPEWSRLEQATSGGSRALGARSGDDTIPARPSRPAIPKPPSKRASPDEQPTAPERPSNRKDPARKGGIHFDDDEDLAEYMHPDDVPPKGTPES